MNEHRTASIDYKDELLCSLFYLPKHTRILRVEAMPERQVVRLHVEGDWLSPIPEGTEPPMLRVESRSKYLVNSVTYWDKGCVQAVVT